MATGTFDQLKDFIKAHLDDPDGLSKAIISLSFALTEHNEELADAALVEKKQIVELLESHAPDGKPMSMTEADTRARVLTGDLYKRKTIEGDAVIELINACKARLTVLGWERKNS